MTEADDPPFLRRTRSGVTVELRVHPRARRSALEFAAEGALKAHVTAPPERGKANNAVIALLAGAWRVPKSALAVTKGASVRDKVVSVAGDPAALAERIGEWTRANG